MAAVPQSVATVARRFSAREYLEHERDAETRSEYFDGVIVAMAGASPEHNSIVWDTTVALGGQIRGGNCQGFAEGQRASIAACNAYAYPDIVIVCGEPRYEELTGLKSLLNPTLIIEVLSDSTEANDRGRKWICFQAVESLQTYILISQDRPLIEVYRRQGSQWIYSVHAGLEGVIALEAIDCELAASDVYDRVRFEGADAGFIDGNRTQSNETD